MEFLKIEQLRQNLTPLDLTLLSRITLAVKTSVIRSSSRDRLHNGIVKRDEVNVDYIIRGRSMISYNRKIQKLSINGMVYFHSPFEKIENMVREMNVTLPLSMIREYTIVTDGDSIYYRSSMREYRLEKVDDDHYRGDCCIIPDNIVTEIHYFRVDDLVIEAEISDDKIAIGVSDVYSPLRLRYDKKTGYISANIETDHPIWSVFNMVN